MGCPIATAPPLTLTLLGSETASRITPSAEPLKRLIQFVEVHIFVFPTGLFPDLPDCIDGRHRSQVGHDGAGGCSPKDLGKTGWKNEDVDLYELNEAFSVQALGVMRELGLDPSKVNVNGGAVAIGHPIGASGARVLVTLIYEMTRRNVHRGIAALCLGGGNAVAMAVER